MPNDEDGNRRSRVSKSAFLEFKQAASGSPVFLYKHENIPSPVGERVSAEQTGEGLMVVRTQHITAPFAVNTRTSSGRSRDHLLLKEEGNLCFDVLKLQN